MTEKNENTLENTPQTAKDLIPEPIFLSLVYLAEYAGKKTPGEFIDNFSPFGVKLMSDLYMRGWMEFTDGEEEDPLGARYVSISSTGVAVLEAYKEGDAELMVALMDKADKHTPDPLDGRTAVDVHVSQFMESIANLVPPDTLIDLRMSHKDMPEDLFFKLAGVVQSNKMSS